MSIRDFSDDQIEQKLALLDRLLSSADVGTLPTINRMYQSLIDEQVRRDILKEDSVAASNSTVKQILEVLEEFVPDARQRAALAAALQRRVRGNSSVMKTLAMLSDSTREAAGLDYNPPARGPDAYDEASE